MNTRSAFLHPNASFEKVLSVFDEYLQQDPLYEVVLTSHGYTLMAWEPRRNRWYTAEIMETPEILLNILRCKCAEFREDQVTDNERDLTLAEQAEISLNFHFIVHISTCSECAGRF